MVNLSKFQIPELLLEKTAVGGEENEREKATKGKSSGRITCSKQ